MHTKPEKEKKKTTQPKSPEQISVEPVLQRALKQTQTRVEELMGFGIFHSWRMGLGLPGWVGSAFGKL